MRVGPAFEVSQCEVTPTVMTRIIRGVGAQVRKRVILSTSADVTKYSRMCAFGHHNDDYMMYFELLEQYSNE